MNDECPNCGEFSVTGLCFSCQEKAKSLSFLTGKSYDPMGYYNYGQIEYELGKERKKEQDELYKNDYSGPKKSKEDECPNCKGYAPFGLCMTCRDKLDSLSAKTGKSRDPLGFFNKGEIDYELGKERKKESDEWKKSRNSNPDWNKLSRDLIKKYS